MATQAKNQNAGTTRTPAPSPAEKLQEKAQLPAAPIRTMADEINALIPQFNRAMPSWQQQIGGGDTLARIALTEFRKTPRLAECSKASFYGSLMTCAQVGMVPGPLGHVFLIPRKVKGVMTCCFEFGYKGLLDLARRSGEISTISAQCVYEGERVNVDLGNSTVEHIYDHTIKRTDPTKIMYVYAIAKLKDGSQALEVMDRDEINAVMQRAQAREDGPWKTDWPMMARKTVLKRLCTKGQIPLSTEIIRDMAKDETVRTALDVKLEPISAYETTGEIPISAEEEAEVTQEETKGE